MTDDTTTVERAADIREAHVDIDGRAVAVIREHLMDGGTPGNEVVAWIKRWLLEEDDKHIETVEGHPQVAVGVIQRESDKAWQIGQAWTDAEAVWFPKSQSRMFALADGVAEVPSDQRTLEDLVDRGDL